MKLLIINLAILLCCSTGVDTQNTIEDDSEYYKPTCVYGHIYYKAGNMNTTVMKLTDDGKPIKCPAK